MRSCFRLLCCLPLLASTACVADAIVDPEVAPQPKAMVRTAEDAAPALEVLRRDILFPLKPPAREPLFVIDGVPVSREALTGLHPDDIEGIEVLSGASLEALYGNRYWSGVILITTRAAARRRR